MDSVSTGAGVLTFIGLALQASKNIYEIVSAIKDAPDRVRSLSSAVKDLKIVLEQLQLCKALADPQTDIKHMTAHVVKCHQDVQRYEAKIHKIRRNSTDGKLTKNWKRLQTFLLDKDVLQIQQEVVHHTNVLGAQLQILSSNATWTSKDKITELNDTISEHLVQGQQQTELMHQQTRDTLAIRDTLQLLRCLTNNDVCGPINTMAQNLSRIPGVSRAQHEETIALLQAIEAKVSEFKRYRNLMGREHSLSAQLPDDCTATESLDLDDEDDPLRDSLRRLYELSSKDSEVLHNEDADIIIQDLTALLDSMSASNDWLAKITSCKGKSKASSEINLITSRELKRLSGLINASRCVVLNQEQRQCLFTTRKTVQKHRKLTVSNESYRAKVRVTERQLPNTIKVQDKTTPVLPPTETIARIQVFFTTGDEQAVLVTKLRQTHWLHSYSSISPHICVGKTIPDDSPIFSVIRAGDVNQVLRMISDRQVTIRDRDSHGIPLLQYASTQPSMFKFLIQHGADVDEVAPNPFLRYDLGLVRRRHSSRPISLLPPNLPAGCVALDPWDSENSDEIRGKFEECVCQLLNTEADPFLCHGSGGSLGHSFWEMAMLNLAGALQMTCGLFSGLVDLNSRNEKGQDLLNEWIEFRSSGIGRPYSAETLQILIRMGFKFEAKDLNGCSALHTAMKASYPMSRRNVCHIVDLLVVLVKAGANVLSQDHMGNSISKEAYIYTRFCGLGPSDVGSYVGDLWDSVLARCGYSITSMRHGFPRVPGYTRKYDRRFFEALWKGWEHCCPYYDDPSFWCPHVVSNATWSENDLNANQRCVKCDELARLMQIPCFSSSGTAYWDHVSKAAHEEYWETNDTDDSECLKIYRFRGETYLIGSNFYDNKGTGSDLFDDDAGGTQFDHHEDAENRGCNSDCIW
jgi:hypothetical protein